jgi:hypothetical protein
LSHQDHEEKSDESLELDPALEIIEAGNQYELNLSEQNKLLKIGDSVDIEKPERFMHLVEVWDSLPIFDDRKNVYSTSMVDLITESKIRPKGGEILIKRGGTLVEGGRYKRCGIREKKVLDVLRYMAAQGFGEVEDANAVNISDITRESRTGQQIIAITFSINNIRSIAKKKFNHNVNWDDIVEALDVLAESSLTISIDHKDKSLARKVTRSIITKISDGTNSLHKIELHPLLTATIIKSHQFQLQHHEYSSFPPVAQAIINRTHLNFTQASGDNSYHFLLSTLYNENLAEDWPTFKGQDVDKKRTNMWRKVNAGLKLLVTAEVIRSFNVELRTHEYRGKEYWNDKLIDITFTDSYVKNRIAATVATRKIRSMPPEEKMQTSIDKALKY